MCRNIKTLFNFEPPATLDEVHAASLQFVRKLSGSSKPPGRRLLFIHTGGQPALFAYERALTAAFGNDDE